MADQPTPALMPEDWLTRSFFRDVSCWSPGFRARITRYDEVVLEYVQCAPFSVPEEAVAPLACLLLGFSELGFKSTDVDVIRRRYAEFSNQPRYAP